MTFQTSLSTVPDQLQGHAADELYTPLADAVGAQAHLSVRGWIPSRMMFEAEVEEAQNGRKVGRFGGRYKPDSPVLELAEAQRMVAEAGVGDRVKVTEGMRQRALKLQIEHAKEEQRLEQRVSHADPGAGTQFLIGATGVAVDFADPVNVGTMLIPGVGAEKVIYGLTKATAKLAPLASKLIVRAGTGAYEGAVSTALAEPLNYAVHQSLGDDYGLADSFENVATNSVAGGVLHALGGLGLDLYRGMRLRPEAGPEGTIRVLSGGAEQLGSMEPIDVTGLLAREPAPAQTNPTPIVEPSVKKRTGPGYARNSILVMPASGASGDRVTIRDMGTLNAVRREYEPVRQAGADETAGASVVDVYRLEHNGDIIVFTQSTKVKGSPVTFTVERLRADDIAATGPLSNRRAAGASEPDARADPLLYLQPPRALAARLFEKSEATVSELERLTREELFSRFQPGEMAGHTIDAQIGKDLHDTYKGYAMESEELHVLNKEAGVIPDSGLTDTRLLSDLKRDSPRGRRNAQETRRKYWEQLNQDTVFPLYNVDHLEGRIATLNDKVVEAWNQLRPTWRAELAARKAELAARRAADRAENAATGQKRTKQTKSTQTKPTQTKSTRKRATPKASKIQ